MDLNKRMRPFWQDAHHLCAMIARKQGRNGLDIRVLDDNPQGEYWDWFDPDQRLKPWRRLHSQSVVFIISDLGQLSGKNSPACQQWLSFLGQLQHQGIKPVVLAPVSPAQQEPELQQAAQQVLWLKHSRLKPQRRDPNPDSHPLAVKRVLGLLSVAAHVEPELLRAIMACLPATDADSGIEAAVWLHEDIQWGYTAISMNSEKRTEYQTQFQKEPDDLKRQVLALIKAHHIGQFPAVWAEEVLNVKPLVDFDLTELADVAQAEQFMTRLTRRFNDSQEHTGMAQYTRRHLLRLGSASKQAYKDSYTSTLYGLAHKEPLRQGAEIPPEYDAAKVQEAIAEKTPARHYYLVQIGEQLMVTTEERHSDNGLAFGIVLAEFNTTCDTLIATISKPDQPEHRFTLSLTSDADKVISLCHLKGQAIRIDTGSEKLLITPFSKPNWAHEIEQTANGLVAGLQLAGHRFPFRWQISQTQRSGLNVAAQWLLLGQAVQLFSERAAIVNFDAVGLYADLTFAGFTQRFRWLEPGTFWMGSPADEPEREWNGEEEGKGIETLHQVTLSQGFWLADTTVTQAFWQAVMGNNPSFFTDNLGNPVEYVSWQDAQAFIAQLNGLFPGLQAKLPSEAQWEVACRAGTQTPFSFGDNITPEQVNYNGHNPYANTEKGLFRQQTVPVKSLPPNTWGLYEMQGNVWEWCEDVWQPHMSADSVTDPLMTGSDENAIRVVRGGSWGGRGGSCRSASRLWLTPDGRGNSVGFRLALGLVEPRGGEKETSGIIQKMRRLFSKGTNKKK